MTSNVGGKLITDNRKIGFSSESSKYENLKEEFLKEAKLNFSPEFLNRIDELIVFQKLNKLELKEISKIMLNDVSRKMKRKNIILEFDESVFEFVVNKIKDDSLGARPLKRIIQDYIQDKIVDELLEGNIIRGDNIKILSANDEICIKKCNIEAKTTNIKTHKELLT